MSLSDLAPGLLLVTTLATGAHADGGAVRLRQNTGLHTITVFTAEPLMAGPNDMSVLVQSAASGEPVLDATVELRLRAPGEEGATRLHATRAQATNKLLYAATVELRRAGTWEVVVVVEVGGDARREQVVGELRVAPPQSALAALWPYLALPPVAVILFALRRWLAWRRPR